jgi:HSP20 family protein
MARQQIQGMRQARVHGEPVARAAKCKGNIMFFSPSAFNRYNRYGYAPATHFDARSFDQTFNRLWDDAAAQLGKGVRVEKDDTSVTLHLDVPGLAKEQLTIGIEGNVVRIESKADAPRSFKAAYQLADEIDAATSQATLQNGVLTLKLGKLAPVSRETVLAIN